ncbi:MAG TPA: hypothetical protein VNU68_26435 [Verrucomicrobiae bacterium]|jgi:predicted alpha/beta hydrolase|nr:hypothetical protein [Verrucomicrobiae bacterium]
MGPQLKETPKEWLKFTVVMAVFPAALAYVLHRRGHLSKEGLLVLWGALLLGLLVSALRPRLCRGFYRLGMTLTFYVGRTVGMVVLLLFFLVLLTPLGWVLRLLGKDLLGMKRRQTDSYWRVPRTWGPLDRMF